MVTRRKTQEEEKKRWQNIASRKRRAREGGEDAEMTGLAEV